MKYASTYILEIETKQNEYIKEKLFGKNGILFRNIFNMEIITDYKYKYQIEMDKSISILFEIMETYKNDNVIIDYTISQSNLEQVFINFTKKFKKN